MRIRIPVICAILAFAGPALRSAPEARWKPVSPEELAATAPEVEPDAPAEIIFREIMVDDRAFPVVRRTRDYVRLKVFDTTNIEELTRLAERWSGDDTNVEIRARLMLPDGTTTEFGAEAVRERSFAKAGRSASIFERMVSSRDDEVKEKFLAITGITAGAVVDAVIERKMEGRYLVSMQSLQRASTPVRRLTYTFIAPPNDDFDHRLFLLNPAIGGAKLVEDTKTRTTTVTAARIPSLVDEPFDGPLADHALVVFSSYSQKQVAYATRGRPLNVSIDPRKHGQWAPVAARAYVLQEGDSPTTQRTRQLAKELIAGAATPEAGAARIHDHVRDLYQGFRLRKKTGTTPPVPAGSLDEVLDWKVRHEQWLIQTQDFGYLAYALYRDAGFEACTLLVPDRELVHFDQALVSSSFVGERCVGVKIGETWHFSLVTSAQPLPFDMLPWPMEGQAALRAKDGKEEFIGVPYTLAEKSIVATSGELRIDTTGTLSGTLTRKFTGHAAWVMRERVRDQPPARQVERLRDALRSELGFTDLNVTETKNLDAIGRPFDVLFTIRHPGYATVAGDRIILRADALRLNAKSPFSSDTRRAAVQFPFAWGESDRISITVPEGFRPESLPPSRPVREGQFLAYAMQVKFDPAQGALQVRREFGVMDWLFDQAAYPALKRWFDTVATTDETEVILTKAAAGP